MNEYRVRSPSYQSREFQSNTKTSSSIPYETNSFQNRRISADRNPRENHFLSVNNPSGFDRGVSPLNGIRN